MPSPATMNQTAIPMPIIDDRGILKLLVEAGDPCQPFPDYSRAVKAIFHYTIHNIPFKNKQEAEDMFKSGQALIDLKIAHSGHPHEDTVHDHPVRVDPNRRTCIGDSRKWDGEPFELRLGKGFSVKAFEFAVRTMRIGERAKFYCTAEYSEAYIQLEAILRRERQKDPNSPQVRHSCCAAGVDFENSKDLYDLYGCPMEMELELVRVVMAGEAGSKSSWDMSIDEKILQARTDKAAGDKLFRDKKYVGALKSYAGCIGLLQSCLAAFDKDGNSLVENEPAVRGEKIKAMSNYCACLLPLERYQEVISTASDILREDPLHEKALYRRAKAYMGHGLHLNLACEDLVKLKRLTKDDSVQKLIELDLVECRQRDKQSQKESGNMFQNIFKL
eukprot:Partr_v1_DN25688_c0_g1_i1_m4655 putative aryl hydrocarbon receptor interacting